MSLFDYRASVEISNHAYPFYGLLMALMRQADDQNIEKLRMGWPDVWKELQARYHAPGGLLDGEAGPPEEAP